MNLVITKNSLEMSYKLMNDMGKEIRRVNSIPFDIDSTEENMLAVSKALNKMMQYQIVDTVSVKKTMILE